MPSPDVQKHTGQAFVGGEIYTDSQQIRQPVKERGRTCQRQCLFKINLAVAPLHLSFVRERRQATCCHPRSPLQCVQILSQHELARRFSKRLRDERFGLRGDS